MIAREADVAPVTHQHRLTFFVPGEPIPEGSLRAQGRLKGGGIRLAHDDTRLKPWRECIGLIAKSAGRGVLPREPIDTGVALGLVFVFSRPLGHFSKAAVPTRIDRLRPCWAGLQPHTSKPDLDKLIRAIGDALTLARVIEDDGRICEVEAVKWYADEASPHGNVAGVHVRLGW
jgi:crossover junction endodeoxyribonuclease RusA